MNPIRRVHLISAVVGALACVGALASPAQAAFPDTRIAIDSNRGGNEDIYTMTPSGNALTRLTTDAAPDHDPAFSPDARKVAFISNRGAPNWEIYTMNHDGSSQIRLTVNGTLDARPVWSPDASKIAFYSDRDGNDEIYVMNADGTAQTRLTNNGAIDQTPSWSPDGTMIAFHSTRDGNREIYVMNADGTGQTRITNNSASDENADWSPDGTKIAFESNRDGNLEIYVMNADGTGQTNVSNTAGSDFEPDWSPTGTQLVFTRNSGGNDETHTMSATGPGPGTNITNNAAPDRRPDWGVVGHQMPASATPIHVPLVVSFRQCGTGANPVDAQHPGPFAVGSCTPSAPTSTTARMGPASTGSVDVAVGSNCPGGPAVNPDTCISSNVTDVQTASGAPHTSSLGLTARIRFTDLLNCAGAGCTGLYNQDATATDLDFPTIPLACAVGGPGTGSTCSVTTSSNAVAPGSVIAGINTSTQIFRIRVLDNTGALFLQQGIAVR